MTPETQDTWTGTHVDRDEDGELRIINNGDQLQPDVCGMRPELTFATPPEPPEWHIHDGESSVGRLFVEDGKLVFKGDVEKSAKAFFDCVLAQWNGRPE